MNKKKILVLAMTVSMVAILALGATLAYFTDTDSQTNVMTLGGVNIEQYEKEQSGEDFEQNQPLLPMVDTREDKTANPVVDGFFDPAMENVVDKIVTVKNEAAADAKNSDAYVRTILAFETKTVYAAGSETEVVMTADELFETYIGYLGDFEKTGDIITVDGVEYVVAVKVYEDALAPQEESAPSLKQIFMAPTANNEISTLFGSEYTILALSQGVQTEGFDDAETALNTAFGEVTAETATAWFSAI